MARKNTRFNIAQLKHFFQVMDVLEIRVVEAYSGSGALGTVV